MKTIRETISNVLTEMRAPATPVNPTFTAKKVEQSRQLFERRTGYQRGSPEHDRLFDAVAQFASEINFKAGPRWLTLSGASGIGKTMLAREVWRHFMDWSRFEIGLDEKEYAITQNTGQFCDWRGFCSDLRRGGFGRVRDLEKDWFVALDDIGSERDEKGFIAAQLDLIANSRSQLTRPKWTLITTNLTLQGIAEIYDQRIADRMLRNGSVVIESDLRSYNL